MLVFTSPLLRVLLLAHLKHRKIARRDYRTLVLRPGACGNDTSRPDSVLLTG